METIGRIVCYGSQKAPADAWYCKKHVGINRLYYIHSGTGGYVHKEKTHLFCPNTLYFIPYTADFTPFCEANDPIMHTYIDFELIPPIITNDVILLDVKADDRLLSAISLFVQGGKMIENNPCDLSALYMDAPFWELCKASILYLVNQVASRNEIRKITDSVVIKALEIMHTRMNERLSINNIARECYMSTDSFIRRFSRTVGITPHSYLKDLRLRTARYLRESGMSLTRIAYETGYSDASSLAHALKNDPHNKFSKYNEEENEN